MKLSEIENGMIVKINDNKYAKIVLSYLANVIVLLPVMFYSGQNFSIDSYRIAMEPLAHSGAFFVAIVGLVRWLTMRTILCSNTIR